MHTHRPPKAKHRHHMEHPIRFVPESHKAIAFGTPCVRVPHDPGFNATRTNLLKRFKQDPFIDFGAQISDENLVVCPQILYLVFLKGPVDSKFLCKTKVISFPKTAVKMIPLTTEINQPNKKNFLQQSTSWQERSSNELSTQDLCL